jgi:hypothetical protein
MALKSGEFEMIKIVERAMSRYAGSIIRLLLATISLLFGTAAPAGAMSLKQLANKLKKTGLEYSIPDNIAANLALATKIKAKYEEVDDAESADGLYRVLFLYGHPDRPEGFIFMTKKIENYRYESFYCRTDLKGQPKAAFRENGEIYPDGTSTRNVPTIKKFIGTDEIVEERLPVELEFWRDGRSRRPKVNPFDEPDPTR